MQAYGEYIIVRTDKNKEEVIGGIIVEQKNTTVVNNGTVVSVGNLINSPDLTTLTGTDVNSDEQRIDEGDVIWFSSIVCQLGPKENKLIAIRKENIIAIESKAESE